MFIYKLKDAKVDWLKRKVGIAVEDISISGFYKQAIFVCFSKPGFRMNVEVWNFS